MHLITGGSGFVGSNLARVLHERGERVRILDVWDSPDRPAGVEFVQCDILDREGVSRAMKDVEFVHHNVALVPLTKAKDRFWKVNVEGTRLALEEAQKTRVRMFIHMSSSAVFGVPAQCPITETTPLRPVEVYGRAKLAGEELVRKALEEGFPCAIIRPRTILGLGRLGIFQILFDWIKDGKAVYVIGSGNELFQFIHADDLAEVSIRCADQRKNGIYNVGTDRYGTLRQDLGSLIHYSGTRSTVRGLPASIAIPTLRILDLLGLCPLAPWHYLTYHKAFYFDLTKVERELGWKPKYSNVEMMTECYDWFVKNYEKVRMTEAGSPHRRSVQEGILKILKWLS